MHLAAARVLCTVYTYRMCPTPLQNSYLYSLHSNVYHFFPVIESPSPQYLCIHLIPEVGVGALRDSGHGGAGVIKHAQHAHRTLALDQVAHNRVVEELDRRPCYALQVHTERKLLSVKLTEEVGVHAQVYS